MCVCVCISHNILYELLLLIFYILYTHDKEIEQFDSNKYNVLNNNN